MLGPGAVRGPVMGEPKCLITEGSLTLANHNDWATLAEEGPKGILLCQASTLHLLY